MHAMHMHTCARDKLAECVTTARACVQPCTSVRARGAVTAKADRGRGSVSLTHKERTRVGTLHGNTSYMARKASPRAVAMRAMQPLDSLDSDERYFDGDLDEDDDDLLGLDVIDDEVLGVKQVAEVDAIDGEGNLQILQGKTRSPYLDKSTYHVLNFATSFVCVKRKDEVLWDFSEVYAADKPVELEEELWDLEFFKVPTENVSHVQAQSYREVAWTRITTVKQDNGYTIQNRKENDPMPMFEFTRSENLRYYLIKANSLEHKWDMDLDFSEVYAIDGKTKTLLKHIVDGAENIGKPDCSLIIRPEGLKVVNLGHYPTADDVIEVEDRKELEGIKKGPDGKGFDMPDDLFKDEFDLDEPDVPDVDLM